MTTFFHLPPEIRVDIYKLVICGRRLKFTSRQPQQQQRQKQKQKMPILVAPPLGRNALLVASRRCHDEGLAILWTYVELNMTEMISAVVMRTSLPPTQQLLLHNIQCLVLDGGQDGKLDERTSASLLSLCPSVTSVTLLCGEQYEISLPNLDPLHPKYDPVAAVSGGAYRSLITRTIRASPWRVLGTKFWRPRADLLGLMRVWKMRSGGGGGPGYQSTDAEGVIIQQGGFVLSTEFQVVLRAVNGTVLGTWDGRFNLDTRLLTISPPGCGFGDEQKLGPGPTAGPGVSTFPLEMLEL